MKFVFLPGLDGTGFLFEPVVHLITAPNSTLVLSYPPDRFFGYQQLETYVRPQLPTHEPYILIAESFGGPLAVRIAAEHPAAMRGMVLSATFVRKPRGRLGLWGEFLIRPWLFHKGLLESLGKWALKAQGLNVQQIALVLKAIEFTQPEILVARLKEALEVDALDNLKDCRVPILCLYAKKDWVLEKQSQALMVRANPRVRLLGLDTPHFLLQAKPLEALQAIDDFARPLNGPL